MQVIGVATSSRSQWKVCATASVLVALCSSALIVGSYFSLSHTWDEPTHVAAGMEWIQWHRYTFQTENPPLSRVPLAILPYVTGTRLSETLTASPGAMAAALFYGSGNYVTNVIKARVANLLFFWLLLALTWTLSGGGARPYVAMLATGIVATLPGIVAHSGLATTDVPFLVALLFCVWCWQALLEQASVKHAALFGLSLGLALATKFSTIPFLPPVALALLLAFWRAGRLAPAWTSLSRSARLAGVVLNRTGRRDE
jgi:Dolichyl-phosphate-mannose-protein mannosyltransferase